MRCQEWHNIGYSHNARNFKNSQNDVNDEAKMKRDSVIADLGQKMCDLRCGGGGQQKV